MPTCLSSLCTAPQGPPPPPVLGRLGGAPGARGALSTEKKAAEKRCEEAKAQQLRAESDRDAARRKAARKANREVEERKARARTAGLAARFAFSKPSRGANIPCRDWTRQRRRDYTTQPRHYLTVPSLKKTTAPDLFTNCLKLGEIIGPRPMRFRLSWNSMEFVVWLTFEVNLPRGHSITTWTR